MIAVLSPAKSLDFEKQFDIPSTKERFHKESVELINVLREKSAEQLKSLMSISDKLAEINLDRYQNYQKRSPSHAKQAVLAFQGDVYQGLVAEDFSDKEHEFAQEHIRILSGLYGLLRPLDLIQPYRLEMGTKLSVGEANSLYEFWDDKILKLLLKDLKEQGDDVIINLASNEYFKSVKSSGIYKKAKVVDVEFKDFKNGKYKIISFFAKKARGLMARYIVKNRISSIDQLKKFNMDGYYFDDDNSTEKKLLFKRD